MNTCCFHSPLSARNMAIHQHCRLLRYWRTRLVLSCFVWVVIILLLQQTPVASSWSTTTRVQPPISFARKCTLQTCTSQRNFPKLSLSNPFASDSLYVPSALVRSSRCRLSSLPLSLEEDVDDEIVSILDDEDDSDEISSSLQVTLEDEPMPEGMKGFVIVKQYLAPLSGFDRLLETTLLEISEAVDRLGLTSTNVTLPIALMMLDPEEYPSFSRARKACRKGSILILRCNGNSSGATSLEINGDNDDDDDDHADEESSLPLAWNSKQSIRGRVGDRVYPGDRIGKQVRMGSGCYEALSHLEPPPFELPVVYEDDHFAIVNKPAGVVVYSHRSGGHGRMTVRSALPYAIQPPRIGTMAIIRRPMAVHRLDKPTSGLLLVAKTKPAMIHMTRQFVERKVKKTYTAIVNGIPDEQSGRPISAKEAFDLGVDVDPNDTTSEWQLIDFTLEEKHAITVWKTLRYSQSLKAKDQVLTLVELKPKTGRYHQLRRHMAWVCGSPLVGDKEYDGGGEAMSLRERGLFLCSNRVSLEHPYYNTDVGRKEWDALDTAAKFAGGMLYLSDDGIVMVHASITLPEKFENFLARDNDRAIKFLEE